MTKNVGKALIDEKYEELSRYIMSLGRRWNLDSSRVDDIVNSVVIRLLEENEKQQFEDNRKMWGRATNIAREEIAKMFSSSLPLSGVGFQAHWTATKALQKAGNDPLKAYKEQTGSSRVSRELMFLVAGGSGLRAPDMLNEIIPNDEAPESSLSIQDEDNIRVALSALSDIESNVVRLKIWNRMTYPQISQELNISHESARSIYKRAIGKLKPLLQASFARLM